MNSFPNRSLEIGIVLISSGVMGFTMLMVYFGLLLGANPRAFVMPVVTAFVLTGLGWYRLAARGTVVQVTPLLSRLRIGPRQVGDTVLMKYAESLLWGELCVVLAGCLVGLLNSDWSKNLIETFWSGAMFIAFSVFLTMPVVMICAPLVVLCWTKLIAFARTIQLSLP
jgi:hypothetical protein